MSAAHTWWAVLCGAGTGLGLWLVATGVPAARPVRLMARVAPYLREPVARSRLLAAGPGARSPLHIVDRLLAPVVRDASRLLDRFAGGARGVSLRLAQAGRTATVEQFRAEQVAWAAIGAAAGTVVTIILAMAGTARPVTGLVLVLGGLAAGAVARDAELGRAASNRRRRLTEQFPVAADLLALSVAAGETPLRALERVGALTRGALADELSRVVLDCRAGGALEEALGALAARTGVPTIARFADGMAVAIDRGTPLADVLRSQAADARDAARRELMESGGRKEIAMMVPICALVLPTTVVFMLVPGLAVLRL